MTQRFRHQPSVLSGCGERMYRQQVVTPNTVSFRVVCQETDLWVRADRLLDAETKELVLGCRAHIEGYIQRHPRFATALAPWHEHDLAPEIVRKMIVAGKHAGVGPMAAVAGALAGSVGRQLLIHSRQVVVENGGDIFLKTDGPVVVGLYAGHSPLSMKMGIRLADTGAGFGLCTSSGTVGHSLSNGSADAVCVLARSCALADAAATAIGNRVRTPQEITSAIQFGQRIDGVTGIVIVVEGEMGAWGQVELVPLKGKKG
ncbi:MAG: UPF0280 family protein [Desulfosarcina sp.]